MDKRPIGIFDSGIGGLTVFAQVKQKLPNEDIIYLGDTKNFPYGGKTREQIISYSIKNVENLISRNVKAIIIACGTATSQSIEVLKNKYTVPIMGIIEPTVEEIKKMGLKEVGIIATEGTIRSKAWETALKKEIKDIKTVSQACPVLANIAEEGKVGTKESIEAIREYMTTFKKQNIKTIILGCTHYPLYREIIKKEMNNNVQLIDTGISVSTKIENYLKQNNLCNEKGRRGTEEILLSQRSEKFTQNAEKILNRKIKSDPIKNINN